MALVRLAQGVIFGFVLGASDRGAVDGGLGPITSTLLLSVSIALLVTAFRTLVDGDGDDTPSKWLDTATRLRPLAR